METNGLHLCIGCMNHLDEDGTCGHCQLVQMDYRPAPRCLLPGTVLAERYMVGSVLGEGNFGITYIGWDMRLEIAIAVKEYYPSEMVSRDVIRGADKNVYVYEKDGKEEYEEKLKKFLDEARMLTRFNQVDGIVSVRDFFYENNTAYIVMEHVNGISVKKHVEKDGRIEGERVLRLVKPVLTALGKVHSTGLIHRDISPDNMLITGEDRLVLIDFGSARIRNADMSKSLTVIFKRGFSPEEQYRSRGKQGAWSDVYALCATMYYMLVGNVPDEAIERMLEDEMPSLLNMPEIALTAKQKAAIMKGISIHASKRYQNVDELFKAIYYEEDGERNLKGNRYKLYGAAFGVAFCLIAGFYIYRLQVGKSVTIIETEAPRPTIQPYQNKTESIEMEDPQPTIPPYTMISFKGLTKKGVEQAVADMGEVEIDLVWGKKYSNTVKKGRVIHQSIAEGTECHPNQRVELRITLSKGRRKVSVPDVLGQDYNTAIDILKGKKLKHKIVWSDNVLPKGTVLSQSKPSGKKASINTIIMLEVSNGKPIGKKVEDSTKVDNSIKNTKKKEDEFDAVIP